MISVGLHFNYWNGLLEACRPERYLELTADTGARAMDFGTGVAMNMSPEERKRFAYYARELGIALTLNGGASGADISNKDVSIRKSGIEACKKVIRTASELECPVWSGVIYAPWLGMPDGAFTPEKKAAMWQRALDSLRELSAFSKSLGVNICLEIVNRFEAYMINTAADGVRFIEDSGCDNIKLLLDMFHMNIEEDCAADALRLALDHGCLGHIHVSESNRRLPGVAKSDIPWKEVLSALRCGGYSGSVIIESFVLANSPASYSFRTWRNMTEHTDIDYMTAQANKSICFIHDMLKAE